MSFRVGFRYHCRYISPISKITPSFWAIATMRFLDIPCTEIVTGTVASTRNRKPRGVESRALGCRMPRRIAAFKRLSPLFASDSDDVERNR